MDTMDHLHKIYLPELLTNSTSHPYKPVIILELIIRRSRLPSEDKGIARRFLVAYILVRLSFA